MNNCIVITGQTATGKTSLALRLAQKHNGELINIDSRQIYQKLDIITGKDITPDSSFTIVENFGDYQIGYYLLDEIKLWLYDMVDPKITFSAFDYAKCARRVAKFLITEGKTPIFVGGSYFYLKNLLYNQIETQVPPNTELREILESKTTAEIQTILRDKDSKLFESLNNSEKHNRHRLIRKIELLDIPLVTATSSEPKLSDIYNLKLIGLEYTAVSDLKTAIETRVHKRVEQGALTEVHQLLANGYTTTDPGLKTIGYIQLIQHLKHNLSIEEAIEQWITKEIQYAKRQLTFMKTNPEINWYSPLDTVSII